VNKIVLEQSGMVIIETKTLQIFVEKNVPSMHKNSEPAANLMIGIDVPWCASRQPKHV
jgi:hypothetical protein